MLSTLFGDDVPNGTPINFDEEDPFLSEEEEDNVAVKAKSREAGTEKYVAKVARATDQTKLQFSSV